MDRAPVDADQIRTLHAAGLSQAKIAQQLGIPRSTVRDRIKALGLSRSLVAHPAAPPSAEIQQLSDERLITMISDLQEIVAWWHDRKAALQQANDGSRATQRFTAHVEQRWIDAIRRKSDLDHLTYTQIVNDAFRHYFKRK
jgi:hypothetical protein